jgi:hypothetical protein
LDGARLVGAKTVLTDLTRADLTGADLTATRLAETTLDLAIWTEETRWPEADAARLRRRSERLTAGVYRIRPGGRGRATAPTRS